jgi:hypothetical protein
MAEPVFMKLGMYIMAHEPISMVYFIYPFHQSVCLYVCMCIPLSLLGNGWVKSYCGNEYTRNNRRIVGRVVFYAVRVILKENRQLILPRAS